MSRRGGASNTRHGGCGVVTGGSFVGDSSLLASRHLGNLFGPATSRYGPPQKKEKQVELRWDCWKCCGDDFGDPSIFRYSGHS